MNARKELILEGLNCASCAAKIENMVSKLDNVNDASMNFVTKTLSIESSNSSKINEITSETKKIVKKLEPHVKVLEQSNKAHDHGHSHDGHSHSHVNFGNKRELIRLILGILTFGSVIFFDFSFWTEFALYFSAYLLIGGDVVFKAFKNILRGQVFDENFLMSIATIGAFAIGEFPEAVAVMLFYQIGEFFQDMAVNRSRRSIKDLLDIKPDYANLRIGNDTKRVSPFEVNIGNIIIVKPGERIPLDGKIIEGSSMVDTSALTGESVPRSVAVGDSILGGFINENGVLTIEVEKEFKDSTVSKILDLVENASGKKAPTEQFITKFARYYTPVVVFSALALAIIPPLVIQGTTFSVWLERALVFLVVSCPCALVVSIPLGFFGGIGAASKKGILIKGGNYLEALNSVDTIVFDKTGTLTKGIFKVTEIHPKNDLKNDELLEYAAYAESYSNHPIAKSILNSYGKRINENRVDKYDEISGHGTRVIVDGKEILAGNSKLMIREGIKYNKANTTGTIVHISIDRSYAGYIIISDEIKADSKKAIKELKNIGIKNTVMLTGDISSVGNSVGNELGIDEIHAELLPDQKVEKLEMLENQLSPKSKLIFVGDGINDAPVLARADIGIAMGGLGSDAAIEAADVVLMTDEPSKIPTAIKIARRTRKIVIQNIVFALGIKGAVLILGALGIATMWLAVFADVGVALIAVLNSMRTLKI